MRVPGPSVEFEGQFDRKLLEYPNAQLSSSCKSDSVSPSKENEGSVPVWKFGKILVDSLSVGKVRRTKVFGVRIEDLPVDCQGVPKIAQRLCTHLEKFGLTDPELFFSSNKLADVDKFKISFDKSGDADLESCSDIKVTASLLKIWIQDLPQPLIPCQVTYYLNSALEKFVRKEIHDVNVEIQNVLLTCPILNLKVLYIIIRLLHKYVMYWYSAEHVRQLIKVFAKILVAPYDSRHLRIVSALIHNFSEIFNESIVQKKIGLQLSFDENHILPVKKYISKAEILKCWESSPIKLASKEDFIEKNSPHRNALNSTLNIRRVNREGNFGNHGIENIRCTATLENYRIHDELNSANKIKNTYFKNEPILNSFYRTKMNETDDMLVALPPNQFIQDVRIQEEIRNVERSSPHFNVFRHRNQRKRTFEDCSPKRKFHSNSYAFRLELKNYVNTIGGKNEVDNKNPKDEDSFINDSVSSSSSESSPVMYKYQFTEQCKFFNSHSNPELSLCYENFPVRRSKSVPCNTSSAIIDSPTMYSMDPNQKILQIVEQLKWIRKKIRVLERDRMNKFDEQSFITNGMFNPEYEKLVIASIIFKNRLKRLRKQVKENVSISIHFQLFNDNSDHIVLDNSLFRKHNNRNSKLSARSNNSKKKKVAGNSDLATIDENELMKFDTNVMSIPETSEEKYSPSQPICHFKNTDIQTSYIHELSPLELIMEYKTTKKDKKKLYNKISAYELETKNINLQDRKQCIHSLKLRYKNTKAKLRLLEALLMKNKN